MVWYGLLLCTTFKTLKQTLNLCNFQLLMCSLSNNTNNIMFIMVLVVAVYYSHVYVIWMGNQLSCRTVLHHHLPTSWVRVHLHHIQNHYPIPSVLQSGVQYQCHSQQLCWKQYTYCIHHCVNVNCSVCSYPMMVGPNVSVEGYSSGLENSQISFYCQLGLLPSKRMVANCGRAQLLFWVYWLLHELKSFNVDNRDMSLSVSVSWGEQLRVSSENSLLMYVIYKGFAHLHICGLFTLYSWNQGQLANPVHY